MSRWIDANPETGTVTEEIASMDECMYLINDVCCCEDSDMLGGYTHPAFCHRKCPYYQDEDGIITDR